MIISSQTGVRSVPRIMVMLTCTVMYAMAAAHYFIALDGLVRVNNTSQKFLDLFIGCMDTLDDSTAYKCQLQLFNNPTSTFPSDCPSSALLLVNVSLFSRGCCKKLS